MKNKKTIKLLSACLAAVLLFVALVSVASTLVEDKLSRNRLLDRQNVSGIYDLPKNSLDVFVTGSSQVMCGYSAPDLFNKYGITSYGLGTGSQPVDCAYYWIREVFKRQKPKVVLFETSGLTFDVYENAYYKAICEMSNFSLNKLKASIVAKNAYNLDILGSYVSLYKFHSRWDEVSKSDLMFLMNEENKSYCGNNASTVIFGDRVLLRENYGTELTDKDKFEIKPDRLDYFNKMVEFCEQNGAKLVLFKVPKESWTDGEYTAAYELAEKYNLKYLDFNENKLFDELGLDLSTDMLDPDHQNVDGAYKLTDYLGNFLKNEFKLESKKGTKQGEYYQDVYAAFVNDVTLTKLRRETNLLKVLDKLDNDNCVVLVAKNGTINELDKVKKALNKLGFNGSLCDNKFAVFAKDGAKIDAQKGGSNTTAIEGFVSDSGYYRVKAGNKNTIVKNSWLGLTNKENDTMMVSVYNRQEGRTVFSAVYNSDLQLIKEKH